MDKSTLIELVIAISFIALLILFLNPFMLWMPTSAQYATTAVFLIVAAVFAGIVWREQPADEREAYHAMLAGRVAYLAGVLTLVFAVAFQSVTAMVDPWLLSALAAMILAKLGALRYIRARR